LTNSCGANQAAKDTCATAQAAASAATKGTGAQADAFNGAFGIQTVRLHGKFTDSFSNLNAELCWRDPD